ncbi:hypothetical protein BC941DRAFT_509884 [Chlamydoabsidia padenii]|nr:hypothetical protein BC941DRAFT_509884 [Chlamydoabsidia padenii]
MTSRRMLKRYATFNLVFIKDFSQILETTLTTRLLQDLCFCDSSSFDQWNPSKTMNYPLGSLGRYFSPVLDVSLENGAIFLSFPLSHSQSNRQVNMMINLCNGTKMVVNMEQIPWIRNATIRSWSLAIYEAQLRKHGFALSTPTFCRIINDVRRRKCIRKMA